jgi:uncharacterized protein
MFKPARFALPAIMLLASCVSASTPPKPQAPARPAMWKLADADTTIYLFGTIHILPKALKWRTAKFNAAIASADQLYLEVADLDDVTKTASTFMKLAASPNLPPVLDRVPPNKRAGLKALIDKSGVPTSVLDTFEDWAIAVTLSSALLKELNVSPEDGVEHQLTSLFRAAKKPIAGLETTEMQLGYFDKLPAKAQQTFLISMVDDASDANAEFRKMIRDWGRGDQAAIALSFDDELKMSAELSEVLIRKRNRNWSEWLAKRLDTPGTVFVAVGAGHLTGKDSVQVMLTKRGLRVARVQ